MNTQGTDGGSVTVGLPSFEFEDTRRQLIATRVSVGAKTPRGHSASNLAEQLRHLQTATGAQRDNLLKAIPYQMARLSGRH